MTTDRHGNTMSGATAEAADLFDTALESFSLYRGDPIAPLDRAIGIAPGFAMARILKAYLHALATEPAAAQEAAAILGEVGTLPLSEREASHAAALRALVAGNWTAAASTLGRHNAAWPRDLLAIQAGHLVDFFRAGSRDLRDRIAGVLPHWTADMPGYAVLLGMHAFGLEETGDYARAEEAGRRAVDLEPRDCWAHHAVAHVMEMQGRAEDGIAWMTGREPHWSGEDNFFKVHNWWHLALFHLDRGQADMVLALYDGPVRQDRSAVAVDMLDASALLWRLHLSGHDPGDRWQELATAWDAHADGRTYPFNDWHAAMAYLGAGRDGEVDRIIRSLRAADTGSTEVAEWGRRTALPLVEGFAAFWRGDYGTAVDRLRATGAIADSFGGSHAQRDIIDWTLTEAALRGGHADLAGSLVTERLARKPDSGINRGFLARMRERPRALQGA